MKQLRIFIGSFIGCVGILFFGGCAKQQTQSSVIEKMSLQELETEVHNAVEQHNTLRAIEHLTQIVNRYGDDFSTPQYRLQLADLHFIYGQETYEDDAFKMAHDYYKKFYRCNPSDSKAAYAYYRAILATFYQTNRFECDSRLVEKTIKSCRKYLANPAFVHDAHGADVKDILYTCQKRMIDKELYIFNTYLRAGNLKSARSRLDFVRDTYTKELPEIEPRLLFLECKLAVAESNFRVLDTLVSILHDQYATSEYYAQAKKFLAHKAPSSVTARLI